MAQARYDKRRSRQSLRKRRKSLISPGKPWGYRAGVTSIRTGQAAFPLSRAEFDARFRARFADPAFGDKSTMIDELLGIAATSHDALDKDEPLQEEVRNAARCQAAIGV
jgi:hypothetical protein